MREVVVVGVWVREVELGVVRWEACRVVGVKVRLRGGWADVGIVRRGRRVEGCMGCGVYVRMGEGGKESEVANVDLLVRRVGAWNCAAIVVCERRGGLIFWGFFSMIEEQMGCDGLLPGLGNEATCCSRVIDTERLEGKFVLMNSVS